MDQRPLGMTGLLVSALGLGTVKLGRTQNVKYPNAFDLPDDETVRSLLQTALDLGINLVDTAPAYGTSEARLGELLPGRREDWVIVTKCGEEFDGGQSSFDFSSAHTQRSVERSLRRLRTDYLDLVLVHSNGSDEPGLADGEAIGTLAALKAQGKIRALGISVKTTAGGMAAIDVSDVLMVTLNAKERESLDVIRSAHARGTGIVVKKALASGHALGHENREDALTEAFRLSLGEPGVSSVIAGTINPQHLRENARAAEEARKRI